MSGEDGVPSGCSLDAMFAGDHAGTVAGMRQHFAWLVEVAAREHDPAEDWDGFVERLWRSTARWAGWVEDDRDWEGVEPPWFASKDDPKVVTWYDDDGGASLS